MSNQKFEQLENVATDQEASSGESRLRGESLGGAEQKASVEHIAYEKSRQPDAELLLDGEDDTLYNDGLDIGDDSLPLAGTDGNRPKGIKG
jgi:3'-phosphoadenosine 5'-phosphosulfate sulfotransferase